MVRVVDVPRAHRLGKKNGGVEAVATVKVREPNAGAQAQDFLVVGGRRRRRRPAGCRGLRDLMEAMSAVVPHCCLLLEKMRYQVYWGLLRSIKALYGMELGGSGQKYI